MVGGVDRIILRLELQLFRRDQLVRGRELARVIGETEELEPSP
jgi:hypothetical protein